MALADIIGTDGAEEIERHVGEATARAREIAEAYEQIAGTPIPSTLRAAVDEQWSDALQGAAKDYLEHYPAEERREDRKRVMRLDDALEILIAFEQESIKGVVLDPVQLVSRYFLIYAETVQYVDANKGAFITRFIEAADAFKGLLLEGLKRSYWEFLKFLINPLPAVQRALENYKLILSAALAVAAAIIAGKIWLKLLEGIDTPKFRVSLKPLLTARKHAIASIRAKALPQGSGRVRRRKRGRA